MAILKDLAQVNAELQEQKERIDTVDFKMVTFSLAGKEYGVDIMNVKEIAKADKFTYVPNAASFVRGVYNLRGDIIPIIDLRMFFHLPVDRKHKDALENLLIIRVGDNVYGTIVDRIDKVVGINSEQVQPPHPIFGDINIKYISGVVEKQGALYIILDVIRIFSHSEEEKQKGRGAADANRGNYFTPPSGVTRETTLEEKVAVSDTALGFIKESLPALKHFYPSDINDEWIRKRFADWSAHRIGEDLQFRNANEAEEFLMPFYSPDTGKFWSDSYAAQVRELLPDLKSNTIHVWNPGCGKGYETYSFACIMKSRYPDAVVKIWANDSDIMAVSQAPNLSFSLEDLPDFCRAFTTRGSSGYGFNQSIRDSIVFEYHDILNDSPLPDLDIILMRDVLSFFQTQDQVFTVSGFGEKLKNKGIVILGQNESLGGMDWEFVGKEPVSMFAYVQ